MIVVQCLYRGVHSDSHKLIVNLCTEILRDAWDALIHIVPKSMKKLLYVLSTVVSYSVVCTV